MAISGKTSGKLIAMQDKSKPRFQPRVWCGFTTESETVFRGSTDSLNDADVAFSEAGRRWPSLWDCELPSVEYLVPGREDDFLLGYFALTAVIIGGVGGWESEKQGITTCS